MSESQLHEWAKAMHALAWLHGNHSADEVLSTAYPDWHAQAQSYRDEKLRRWTADPLGFLAHLDTPHLRRLVAGMVRRYDRDAQDRLRFWPAVDA